MHMRGNYSVGYEVRLDMGCTSGDLFPAGQGVCFCTTSRPALGPTSLL
jgi:hypothetical protein